MKTDLALALRLMRRQPVLSATAAIALAVGIGVATTGLTFMNALLFSRLPFENGDRFVRLRTVDAATGSPASLDLERLRAFRIQSQFEHIGGLTGRPSTIVLPAGRVEVVATAGITPASLRFVPHRPVAGRAFDATDAAPGAPRTTMARERFWRLYLNGDPAAIGRPIDIGGVPHTLVGILADDFEFPNRPDLWVPIDETYFGGSANGLDSDVRLFGVLAPGASLETAAAQINAASQRVDARQVRVEVSEYTDLGAMATVLPIATVVAVLAVLIVIAANVSNLILARSLSRTREFALRTALGASRSRLVTQVFLEVLAIGVIAGIVGRVGGKLLMDRFIAGMGDELPFWMDLSGGPFTSISVIAVTVLACAIAGIFPALKATRANLDPAIRVDDPRGSLSFGRFATVMVVVQVALSVALVNTSLVFARGMQSFDGRLIDLPRGQVLTASVSVNAGRGAGNEGPRDPAPPVTMNEVLRVIREIPGVVAAGGATSLPRQSPDWVRVDIESASGAPARTVATSRVTTGFIEALGGRALAGRLFMSEDLLPGSPAVAIVNEPFARAFLSGVQPIGLRIRVTDGNRQGRWLEIVGLVPDLGLNIGEPERAAGFYTPLVAGDSQINLVLRSAGDPRTLAGPLRTALSQLSRGLTVDRIVPLEEVNREDRVFFASAGGVLVALGLVTLVLALAGVYAMTSLLVTRRTREIGIRVALGASPADVVKTTLRKAAIQVGLGTALGYGLGLLASGARELLAFRIGDGGPWILPAVTVLFALAGVAATWAPVRRALRIRPIEALRAQ